MVEMEIRKMTMFLYRMDANLERTEFKKQLVRLKFAMMSYFFREGGSFGNNFLVPATSPDSEFINLIPDS